MSRSSNVPRRCHARSEATAVRFGFRDNPRGSLHVIELIRSSWPDFDPAIRAHLPPSGSVAREAWITGSSPDDDLTSGLTALRQPVLLNRTAVTRFRSLWSMPRGISAPASTERAVSGSFRVARRRLRDLAKWPEPQRGGHDRRRCGGNCRLAVTLHQKIPVTAEAVAVAGRHPRDGSDPVSITPLSTPPQHPAISRPKRRGERPAGAGHRRLAGR